MQGGVGGGAVPPTGRTVPKGPGGRRPRKRAKVPKGLRRPKAECAECWAKGANGTEMVRRPVADKEVNILKKPLGSEADQRANLDSRSGYQIWIPDLSLGRDGDPIIAYGYGGV